MAYTVEEIRVTREEETKREKLPLSDETRAGLEHHYFASGTNPGRSSFARISLRDIPDFTANDFQLRIVVAQTAYNRLAKHGRSLEWERIPELLTIDPQRLSLLILERLDKQSVNRPDLLTKFNTSKDYVACLSAVAYLKWRVGLHHDEIAQCLNVPVGMVQHMSWRLRFNAAKLGMTIRRKASYRGPKPHMTDEEFRARMQEVAARPGHKEKQSAGLKKAWTPEYKAAQHAKGRWKNTGSRKGVSKPWKPTRKSIKGIPQPWTPERKAAYAARRKQIELERFLKTVAWE
jgi:hypothetical protein